ncbi:MAG: response regulator transcription factor [Clostridia bacterium]|nr:response regulator transcription factor [Clostridia bacterium]
MRKILIVDDEEKIRELIKINLELAGYICSEAEDGAQALNVMKEFKPDLALLDIMLPIKNGYEIAEDFIKNKNLALSREKLLESAWGYDYVGDTRTVDMHIQRLRKKLEWENVIVTVYKYGYRLEING